MVLSIFILFYFSLKLIFAENLNEANFLYQFQNNENEIKKEQFKENITSIFSKENESQEESKEILIGILELFRSSPKNFRVIFNFFKPIIKENLGIILNQANMSFLCNLTEDFFRENNTFFNDAFDVIENHPELINYTLIILKGEIEGKNITQTQIFDIIHYITNIEGMDKVFGHIINSTHNDAILKLIDTKFLNGTKYATFNDTFYPYKDQVIRIMYIILKEGLFSSENEQNKNITIYILELIRDNPKISSKIFDYLKLYLNDNKDKLKEYLVQTNMSFLYNLTEEIIDFNSTFFDDLSKVIENHPEIINYTLIVVNADARGEKNMTNHLKNITYILNIDGMDKVFSHIINSTHNGAIFKLIEKRIINGTKYTTLFGYFKPILIKYKDPIIRFMYQMLKTYYDKNALRDVITNFFLENRNNELMRDLREKCKEENVRKELKEKIMLFLKIL